MKKKILCIIGPSGSGKTLFERLLTQQFPGLFHRICSYTTRKMRYDEANGREHWFVGKELMPPSNRMLAFTTFGDNYYWADADDLQSDVINTYVIDVAGLHWLKHYYGNDLDIRVLYVKRTNRDNIDSERKQRDKGMPELKPDEIDCVIRNEGSKIDFQANTWQLVTYIKNIFNENVMP